MQPPYHITPEILQLIQSVSEKIGAINTRYMDRQTPLLRRQNKIKTIHASLQIEGNQLTEEQVTAILDKKHVVGSAKEIQEVRNAIEVYDQLDLYNYTSEKSFLKAHHSLMKTLVDAPGKYRKAGVGIVKGSKLKHLAPPSHLVPEQMKNLFRYLKQKNESALIKSCVFHYEMEFIHPFIDGNGRMGRLWQTLILSANYPVFESLPFESLIRKTQKKYYKALAVSDQIGHSTPFIEYMLEVMDQSLGELMHYKNRVWKDMDRLNYFLQTAPDSFTRKDYMMVFKDISAPTASRDLNKAVSLGWMEKVGDKNKTSYLKL